MAVYCSWLAYCLTSTMLILPIIAIATSMQIKLDHVFALVGVLVQSNNQWLFKTHTVSFLFRLARLGTYLQLISRHNIFKFHIYQDMMFDDAYMWWIAIAQHFLCLCWIHNIWLVTISVDSVWSGKLCNGPHGVKFTPTQLKSSGIEVRPTRC